MNKTALCLVAGSLLAGFASAEPQRPLQSDSVSVGLASLDGAASSQHKMHMNRVGQEKLALRDEALRLRTADGGTLTVAHRTYLQHKLDRINGS